MRDKSIIATAWSERQPTVLTSSLLCPRSLPLRLSTYSRGNQVGNRLGSLDTNEAIDCKGCIDLLTAKSRELQFQEGPTFVT